MKTVNSLNDAIELSLKNRNVGTLDANFPILIENKIWDVYEVSISHRDIFCISNNGTCTFVVDTHGDYNVAVLFDWSAE